MQGYDVNQGSAAYPLVFLLIQSADHISPLIGATPSVTISKNGGAFAAPAGAVTAIANGWYAVAGNATDTNTLGPLLLHATAAGADPCDAMFPVVSYNPQQAPPANFPALSITAGGAVTAGTVSDKAGYTLATLPAIPANWITAAGITAAALNGKGDWLLASSYTTAPTVAAIDTQLSGTHGAGAWGSSGADTPGTTTLLSRLTATRAGYMDNLPDLDAAVSSRSTYAGGPVASVTAAVTIAMSQVLGAPRALDAVADGAITINDAFWGAVAASAGKEDASSGTSMVVKTPATGTTLRTFTITTSATNPFGSRFPVSRS